MAKNKYHNKKPAQKANKIDNSAFRYLSIIIFVLLAILIFYPPFMRGLFFNKEMFVTHIITAVIFILVWIHKFMSRNYRFLETPLDWSIIAYTGAYLISLFAAVHISDAIYGFMKVLNYFMIYWMVTYIIKEFGDYKKILQILIAGGFGVALIGILAALKLVNYPCAYQDQVILSTLQYPNSTAAYLSALLLIVLTLLNIETKLYVRIILEFIGYIMMLVILCAMSKGAWLILIAGGLLLFIGVSTNAKIKTVFNLGIIVLAAGISFIKFYPAIVAGKTTNACMSFLIGSVIIVLGLVLGEGIALLGHKNKKLTILISGIILLVVISMGYHKVSTAYQRNLPGNFSAELTTLRNLSDVSYTTRFDMMRWGMAIVKDHPVIGTGAGGWNALYHQYQDRLYWATEVHNHYLQVWIEAGTIGLLAFLSIWACLVWAVISIKKLLKTRSDREGNDKWILVWGTFSGALALGMHAGIDFDFSLGAICILLWVLFGLVNSAYIMLQPVKDTGVSSRRGLLNIGLAGVIALVMLIIGTSFAIASISADKGDRAMAAMSKAKDSIIINQQYNLARNCYERAVDDDSRNAYYKAKLANNYALEWQQLSKNNDPNAEQVRHAAVDLLNQAMELRPYDNDLNNNLIDTLVVLGDLDMMMKVSLLSIQANPNDINTYNLYAQTLGKGMEYYKSIKNLSGERKMALELVSVERMVKEQRNRQSHPDWEAALVLSQDSLNYIVQAHMLLDK